MPQNYHRFKDQVVLVTGGASGMGRTIALRFAAEGAKVAIVDRIEEPRANNFPGDQATPTAALIKSQGGSAIFIKTDLVQLDQVEAMVAKTVREFGKLDVLVQAAGIVPTACSLLDQTPETWDLVININTRALLFGMQHAVRQMLKQPKGSTGCRGKIVNISSINGLTAGWHITSYTGSKHAVVGISKAAAIDHAKDGININVVAPGVVKTAMVLEYFQDTEIDAYYSNKTALPRTGSPDDIASTVLHLSSEEADWVTGCVSVVDGGLLAGY